jgi:hypothetical protein
MSRARRYPWRTIWSRWFQHQHPADRALAREHSYAFLVQTCIFALSAGYFSADIGTREVSLLEAQDLGIATDLFKTYGLSAEHSPLHFVFVNVWQRLNATSVTFLRAPSVLFCALSAVVVFSLARRVAGTGTGVLAAFFLTMTPQVVDAARSMRLYSLFILCSASCAWFAHAYLARSRSRSYLLGFAASLVVAVYTHLFAWLMAASFFILFGTDLYRNWWDEALRRRGLRYLAGTTLLLLPQLVHGIVASELARGRHALYSGISAAPTTFLVTVARTLFLGESEAAVPVGNYFLLVPLTLFALGIFVLKRRGAAIAAAIFLPALLGAWFLSRTSQVEARYLCFLAPAIAVFMGVGAVRAPKAQYVAPLVVTVFWLFHFATERAYRAAPIDWYEVGARVDLIRTRGDVVAVFPGYFVHTFRRYSSVEELVPITFPADLQRLLTRGRRVLLVVNSGRYFGNIEAILNARTRWAPLFESTFPGALRVLSVSAKRRDTGPPIRAEPNSILIAGVVGSGGFPWQANSKSRPLARLAKLFASSRFVLADYEAYHPDWLARLLIGPEQALQLLPGPMSVNMLQRAGVSAIFTNCESRDCAADANLLGEGGLRLIPQEAGSGAKIEVFQLDHVTVGVFTIALDAIGESADLPEQVTATLRRARASVGDKGRLIGVFRATADYSRLPSSSERHAARRLIDAGVDVVLGEGGYAAKEVEAYSHGVIAYSLGTLLRPPLLSLAMRDSTGIALRLGFPEDGPLRYAVIPVTFDDTAQAALGEASASDRALSPEAVGSSLLDQLSSAHVSYLLDGGESRRLDAFRDRVTCLQPWEERLYQRASVVTHWFPEAPITTPLRPFADGFCDANAYVAERGVLSLGEYRRAIEIGGPRTTAVRLRFPGVVLGGMFELTYGIPDDRLLSKFLPLHDQTITVAVGTAAPIVETIPYRAGWKKTSVDTSSMRGTTGRIDITLQTNGTHFPVAVDARVRDP